MALKIEHIDEHSVRGTLDGTLDFTISHGEAGTIAKIANWSRAFADRSARTVAEMRCLTYELLARYREDQRGAGA